MSLISSFYVHFCWFLFILITFFSSLLVSFYVSFFGALYLSFSFLSSFPLIFNLSFFFDPFSSWFLSIVLFISSVIIIYSYFYISPYYNSNYFLVLTVLFVLSMCLVICISNLFFVMLGWDGLGLVSFFLIVYYQNQSSVFSGLFTLLINRFGDGLFLCTISIFSFCLIDYYTFSSSLAFLTCLFFLVLTFITNSAIYPFSPWLPIAIAAPTPISALVHSSTLVTSGLFLMINYSYLIYSSSYLCSFLLTFSLFTSFYAGFNTVFENDLNKLIALSTLSHLGFIGMSFSLGLLSLSFFHLLSHALFKSLLFITIGDIIINLAHSQDIRFLSSGSLYTPFSCFIMYVSLLNLIGLPSLVGFFSNDLVLESCNFTNFGLFLYSIFLINLVFTFYYTFQLFYYSFSFNNTCSYLSFHGPSFIHSFLLFFLSLVSLLFGYFFLSFIYTFTFFVPVPLFLKLLPNLILLFFFSYVLIFLSLFTSKSQTFNSYFSTIMFLYPFITNVTSSFYYSFSFYFVNTFELGNLNSFLNLNSPSFFYAISHSFLQSSSFPSFYFISFCLIFFAPLLIF